MTAHAVTRTPDAMTDKTTTFARYVPTVARILLGLGFLASGVSGLLMAAGVFPMPQPARPPPENAMAFMMGLMKSGYLFPLIKGTETVGGALLVANRFVPLALAILAPVLVNILAFHAFLGPSGIVPGLVLFLLEVYVAWSYRDAFRPMLASRAKASAP